MQKINGSGVMVFVKSNNINYILLLYSATRGGVYFSEPGGKLETNLNPEQNAKKELFEETYASILYENFSKSKSIIVNNKYICHTLYIEIDNIEILNNIMNNNKKILQQANLKSLHCFTEMLGFTFINIELILGQNLKKVIQWQGQQILIHKRTLCSIEGLIKEGIIQQNYNINLDISPFIIKQHNYIDITNKLHILHKQQVIVIQ